MTHQNQSEPIIGKAAVSSDLLSVALPILQGLLASGHYTARETDIHPPFIRRCDNGKDWDVEVFARRHTAIAIEDAIDLAGELLKQIRLDTERVL